MTTRALHLLLNNPVPCHTQRWDQLWQLTLLERVGWKITVHKQSEEAGGKQRITSLPSPILKHSTQYTVPRYTLNNKWLPGSRTIFIVLERKEKTGTWHCLVIWTYPIGQGRRQIVVVGEAGSSNSHKIQIQIFKKKPISLSNSYKIQISPSNSHRIQMLHYALDGKGFILGTRGRKGGEKNAQTMLCWSYLVRRAIFPSDILEPPKCLVSMRCCLDAVKGTALRWEKRSYAHLLTCSYCCWVF